MIRVIMTGPRPLLAQRSRPSGLRHTSRTRVGVRARSDIQSPDMNSYRHRREGSRGIQSDDVRFYPDMTYIGYVSAICFLMFGSVLLLAGLVMTLTIDVAKIMSMRSSKIQFGGQSVATAILGPVFLTIGCVMVIGGIANVHLSHKSGRQVENSLVSVHSSPTIPPVAVCFLICGIGLLVIGFTMLFIKSPSLSNLLPSKKSQSVIGPVFLIMGSIMVLGGIANINNKNGQSKRDVELEEIATSNGIDHTSGRSSTSTTISPTGAQGANSTTISPTRAQGPNSITTNPTCGQVVNGTIASSHNGTTSHRRPGRRRRTRSEGGTERHARRQRAHTSHRNFSPSELNPSTTIVGQHSGNQNLRAQATTLPLSNIGNSSGVIESVSRENHPVDPQHSFITIPSLPPYCPIDPMIHSIDADDICEDAPPPYKSTEELNKLPTYDEALKLI